MGQRYRRPWSTTTTEALLCHFGERGRQCVRPRAMKPLARWR
ncbi:hypothetical protein ES288_D05G391000v1 [Gossypium darwinii]|uniref:Uncharacterized protein n=1 Tax=Gossypium darwinii TaxID=34276 RepID=A0A5D2CT17_GOSDA|nr:hypothetical protein ES288_D05G391000v1 [Gossypium darwinii]